MKNLLLYFLIILTSTVFGQTSFNDCAAICINDVVLVNDYSPRGQCTLKLDATGRLTVNTVNLSDNAIIPQKTISFKIAIRDAKTNTVWSFSEKTFTNLNVEKVLAKCKEADHIIILTTDQTFALPHNEILVQ